jgi:hypothetical protein
MMLFEPDVEVIHVVQDWSRYQLDGYHILSFYADAPGCREEHLVALNPVNKGGRLWIHNESSIKAACPTLAAAQAAKRLLEM